MDCGLFDSVIVKWILKSIKFISVRHFAAARSERLIFRMFPRLLFKYRVHYFNDNLMHGFDFACQKLGLQGSFNVDTCETITDVNLSIHEVSAKAGTKLQLNRDTCAGLHCSMEKGE